MVVLCCGLWTLLFLQIAERFMVASYNILADRNAFKHRDLYTNVPLFYLKWSRRRRVICEELIGWNPDIICLQVRILHVFVYYGLEFQSLKFLCEN